MRVLERFVNNVGVLVEVGEWTGMVKEMEISSGLNGVMNYINVEHTGCDIVHAYIGRYSYNLAREYGIRTAVRSAPALTSASTISVRPQNAA